MWGHPPFAPQRIGGWPQRKAAPWTQGAWQRWHRGLDRARSGNLSVAWRHDKTSGRLCQGGYRIWSAPARSGVRGMTAAAPSPPTARCSAATATAARGRSETSEVIAMNHRVCYHRPMPLRTRHLSILFSFVIVGGGAIAQSAIQFRANRPQTMTMNGNAIGEWRSADGAWALSPAHTNDVGWCAPTLSNGRVQFGLSGQDAYL